MSFWFCLHLRISFTRNQLQCDSVIYTAFRHCRQHADDGWRSYTQRLVARFFCCSVYAVSQVNIEIRDLQRAIDLLRCSINEKEYAMKIAQTRLDERTRRLCVEVCFDEPMKGSVSISAGVSLSLRVCACVHVSICTYTDTQKHCHQLSSIAYLEHELSD